MFVFNKRSSLIIAFSKTSTDITAFQTYVDSLKESGTFNAQAQSTALLKAKEIALSQMTAEVKECIIKNYGDIENWLTTQIEATIKLIKNK